MKASHNFVWGFVLMLFSVHLSQSVNAEDKAIERYSASIASAPGSARGRVPITMLIYGYTSEEDNAKLAEALKTGGQDAVVKAISTERKGSISPVGGLAVDINYVRISRSQKGKIIRMVTARAMTFYEWKYNGRSTDYPFGIVELTIADNGKIEGTITGAAKIEIDKDNALRVESYSARPVRLTSIRKD